MNENKSIERKRLLQMINLKQKGNLMKILHQLIIYIHDVETIFIGC